ncbi:MAG: type II secretion system F family protein, partial [Candidatus Xenobia bacterium]
NIALPDFILQIGKTAPDALAWVAPIEGLPSRLLCSFLICCVYTVTLRPRLTGTDAARGVWLGVGGWVVMIAGYALKAHNGTPFPGYGNPGLAGGLGLLSNLTFIIWGAATGWLYGWTGTLRRSFWRDFYVAFKATLQFDGQALAKSIQQPVMAVRRLLAPKKPNLANVATMARRLAIMWKASIPVVRALNVLADQEMDPVLKECLLTTVEDIHNGKTMSQAMARHSNVFTPLFLGMVRVGESSGRMDLMLARLADYLEAELTLRRRTMAAMTYPGFIFICCLLIAWGIFTFIIPTLIDVIVSLAGPRMHLPIPTLVLMWMVNASRNHVVQISSVLGVAWILVYAREYYKTATGRFTVDKWKLSVPVLGTLNKKIVLTRFCRALGTMVDSGVPVLMAIELMFEVVDNEYFRRVVLVPVYKGVRQGDNLSKLTRIHPFFPEMMNQLLAVGEETGEYGKMLYQLERFYEVEVNMALEAFLALLEPCLIAVMGGVVCFVLLGVFLPLYQVVSAIT